MPNLTLQYASIVSRFLRWSTCCGIVVMLFLNGGIVEGSIIGPDLPEFKFDEGRQSSSGRSTTPDDSAPAAPTEQPMCEIEHALGALGGSSSGSGTSSSSSSTSTSTASSVALRSLAMFTDADLVLTGWVSGEQRFSLPTSPGNDLLRPPQV